MPRADKLYIRLLLDIYSNPIAIPNLTLPESELCNAGTVLLLYDQDPDGEDDQTGIADLTDGIGHLLFGNVKVHPMKYYLTLLGVWKAGQTRDASSSFDDENSGE